MVKGPAPQPWQVAASATPPPGSKQPTTVSPGQLRQMENAAAPPPAPVTPPHIPTDARGFQTYLNQLGAKPPLVVDGKIGPKTLAAAQQLNIAVPDNLAPKPAQVSQAPATGSLTAPPAQQQKQQQQAVDEAAPIAAPLTAQQIQDEVKTRYGYMGALLDHPDVAAALANVVQNDLTDAQALALLYNTDTWKTSSAAQRNWEALPAGDQQAQIEATKATIGAQARALGVTVAGDRLTQIASDAARLGWNASQINSAIAAEWHYVAGAQTGAIGQAEASIRADARDYGVSDLIGDAAMASYDAQIANGSATAEQIKQRLVELAQARFPGLAGQITVSNPTANALSPYRQAAAQELQIDPNTIDFSKPMWSKAVNQIDDKGNHTPMPLWQWQQTLKSDEQYRWDYTPDGVAAGYAVGGVIKQALGL